MNRMTSSYEIRVLELTEAGAPNRIAQTRAAAEFLRERGMSLVQAIANGVLTIDEKVRSDIDEEFLQRLLDKMGVQAEAAVSLDRIRDQIWDLLSPAAKDSTPSPSIKETFDEFVIIEEDGKFFRVDYTTNEEGDVTLGDRVEVELQYIPIEGQMRKGSTKVQSILFPAARFDVPKARKWAKDHDFPTKKVTTEKNFVHVRVRDPSSCKAIRTINFGGGIKARVCVGQ